MPDLITASGYVAQWGYMETGQLLTQEDVVDDTTADTPTAYRNAMETDGTLNANIVTALNVPINRAEALIRANVEQWYTYPPETDGESVSSSILENMAYIFARFYLHDMATDRVDMPKVVKSLYDEQMKLLKSIGKGETPLIGLDSQPSTSDTILYAI